MIQSTSPSDGTVGPNSIPLGVPNAFPKYSAPQRDSLSLDQDAQLRSVLAGQPEVRPEMVAKGMALAADPTYPPPSMIRGLADMVLNSPDLSESEEES
jgi:hypothetical protein